MNRLLAILGVLTALDVITTLEAVRQYGLAAEGNPLTSLLLSFGPVAFIAVKAGTFVLFAVTLHYSDQSWPVRRNIALALIVLYAVVVLSNFAQLAGVANAPSA